MLDHYRVFSGGSRSLISSGGTGFEVSLSQLNIGLILYVFIAGMIAISAMVLPGISGSTLLLISDYIQRLLAQSKVLTFNFSYLLF